MSDINELICAITEEKDIQEIDSLAKKNVSNINNFGNDGSTPLMK